MKAVYVVAGGLFNHASLHAQADPGIWGITALAEPGD
jgi:hypothetical protein